MSQTEIEICKQIAAGALPSPQPLAGGLLIDVRVSGTGVAFRPSVGAAGEFVFRDPRLWVTDAMCERTCGLPLIVEHPEGGGALTSKDFMERCIGFVLFPYLDTEEGELRAVCRVIDAGACAAILTEQCDVSPAVLFENGKEGTTISIETESGPMPLLIEAEPYLLDHLALLPGTPGVWTKGGSAGNGTDQSNAQNLAEAVHQHLTEKTSA